jgi:cell division protein FtsB
MLEFQEKRRLKKFLYSKITLIILVIFIVLLLNEVVQVYRKQDTTVDNLSKTAASFESLRAREQMLLSEVERLKTESGKEEEIREKFGLVKPSEEVIIVVDKDGDSDSEGQLVEKSFWQKIINWLQ